MPTGAAKVYTQTSYSFYSFSSCTNYHLQFEEVGSPAASEAMEEQADTKRTETARASHSQHTGYDWH